MGTWGSSRTHSQALVAQHPGRRAGSGSPAMLTFDVCPQDAMRSVTKQAIREARLKEIKEELLHSEKLKVRDCGRGGWAKRRLQGIAHPGGQRQSCECERQ